MKLLKRIIHEVLCAAVVATLILFVLYTFLEVPL